MVPARVDHACQREVALGQSVRKVAADLRLLDLADIVAYLKTGQIASAATLVQSSIELSFEPDTLFFGASGDVSLRWGHLPQVSFDLEFHHQSVHVYFRLLLEADVAGVEISYIAFDRPSAEPEVNTQRLITALIDAQRVAVTAHGCHI